MWIFIIGLSVIVFRFGVNRLHNRIQRLEESEYDFNQYNHLTKLERARAIGKDLENKY